MRKFISLALALMLALSLCSFAGAESTYNMPELNTTDEITLTIMTWDDFELTQALCDKFHELHPNITVEIMQTTTGEVDAQLVNLAAEQNMPDMFFHLSIDTLLASPLMADITEYIENDEEAQTKLYPSLRRVGYVDGERCFFMPGEFLPAVIYLDKAVFDKLNRDMPAQDWTWDEMVDIIETMTDSTQGIWAYNFYMGPVTIGPIALQDNVTGEFGWNGEQYDFNTWAEMMESQAEWRRLGYQAIQSSEEYLAVQPDDLWPGESGHVAMQMDAYWTMNNIYFKTTCLERGVQMVPYNVPVDPDTENGGQFAWIDMCSVSAQCEHPREAYEALKFLTWGKEGWMARAELYPTIMNADGNPMYDLPGSLPMIQDDEVNAALAPLFPGEDKLGYSIDWEGYLANINNPVTFGGRTIPGFNTFVTNYYHGADFNGYVGIETAINEGAVDPYDYVDELAKQGRKAYDDSMAIFYTVYPKK